MSVPRYRHLAVLLAIVLVSACTGGDAGDVAPSMGLDGPDHVLAWAPTEVFAVGGFEAPDWATFGSVTGMGFDSRGFLYVLDDQASTITQISPEGDFVRTIGRPGEGPGELARPLALLVLADDRIAVVDIGHRGFVIFDAEGNWVENVPVDMSTEGLPVQGLTAHPSGDIVSRPGLRMTAAPAGNARTMSVGGGDEPEGDPIHRYALGGGRESSDFYYAWEPPPPPEGGESEMSGGSGGNRVMFRMQRLRAFSPDVDIAMLPDGRVVVADTTTYTLKLVDTETGQEVGRLERPIAPTVVDARIESMERDRRLATVRENPGGGMRVIGPGGSMSFDQDAMRKTLEDQIANMAFYPEIPVVEQIAVDSEGRIWVQRSSGVPGEDGPTDVITPEGGYLGTLPADGLRIPRAFGPAGLFAEVETDEFDVPTIRVKRLPPL